MSGQDQTKIVKGAHCGCYFCLRIFNGDCVTEWTDDGKTAICPHCGIDSVTEIKSITDLFELHEKWFTTPATPDDEKAISDSLK